MAKPDRGPSVRRRELEDLLNGGTLTGEQKRALLTGPEIDRFCTEGGRYHVQRLMSEKVRDD